MEVLMRDEEEEGLSREERLRIVDIGRVKEGRERGG